MRAYQTIRFIEGPDVVDIHQQGRKTSVGRVRRGEVAHRYKNTPTGVIVREKIVRHEHGYIRSPKAKAWTRRYLKRQDKARSLKEVLQDEIVVAHLVQADHAMDWFDNQQMVEESQDYEYSLYDDVNDDIQDDFDYLDFRY